MTGVRFGRRGRVPGARVYTAICAALWAAGAAAAVYLAAH